MSNARPIVKASTRQSRPRLDAVGNVPGISRDAADDVLLVVSDVDARDRRTSGVYRLRRP